MERGQEVSHVSQGAENLAYTGRESPKKERGSFVLQGSEAEVQETIKEGHNYFGTVDLGHNLEAGRSEDSTGKEMKS